MVTPLIAASSSSDALRLLMAGDAKVAVLGLFDPEDRWWARLQPTLMEGRYVFGCVPFVAVDGMADAWLFGAVTPEASGDDLSLVRLEADLDVEPRRLVGRLAERGLQARHIAMVRGNEGMAVHLVEVQGFLVGQEAELARTLAPVRQELLHFTVLGAYPRGLMNATAG
jgi:murein tripeptide amidase MpaA